MRSLSLTQQSKKQGDNLVTQYSWRGLSIPVYDSARNGLLIIELFADEELTEQEKAQLLPHMLFPDPAEAFASAGDAVSELLWDIVWEAFGLDITPDQTHQKTYEDPIFDWQQDAARISASFLQCYGIEWRTVAENYSYSETCALLGAMLESDSDTPFKEAVYYRTAKSPKRNKHNREYCESFEDKRRYFSLDQKPENRIQKADSVAADMFAAAKRAAQGAVANG